MLRRLSYGLLLALVLLGACRREPVRDAMGQHIELTLRCSEPYLAKAGNDGTLEGLDRYNENLIDTVDFFFYPGDNPSRTERAKFHVQMISGNRFSDVFLLAVTPDDIDQKIFPRLPVEYRKATVFAVVNYPGGHLVSDEETLDGTSLEDLEATVARADFATPERHRQAKFMMSGSSVINMRSRTQILTATGAVDLTRYASKMTVGVKVSDTVTLPDGQVWHPLLEGMELYLVNAVKTVSLDGMDSAPEFFSYSGNRCRFVNKDPEGNLTPVVGMDGDYYSAYPMYTYPQQWVYGATEGYRREPYLKLVVPWAREEANGFNSTQTQLYYKIVMPDDRRGDGFSRCFIRNNWYHMNIDVGILGAETDEASLTIDPGTCFMVYWQEKDFIVKQAEIGNARYLSVERESYVLNNVNSVTVSYTTSHPVITKSGTIKVTRPYYGDKTSGETLGGVVKRDNTGAIYPVDSYYLDYDEEHRRALNGGEDWFENTGTALVFNHPIVNDYTLATFDYSPYTVTFTLVHEDRPNDSRYSKDIKIIQYPAIYIETKLNSDDTFVFLHNGSANRKIYSSEHWGYVYVDGEQLIRQGEGVITDYADIYTALGYDKEEYHWRVCWYTGGSRDIFKINVTVLPVHSGLVIGDPRSAEIDNLRSDFHVRPALYGDSPRSLQYYYPAERSDRTANMMAPSFRIASKCGGVEFDGININQAKWRCATYQEDGYPAGRWRLPTKGEIQFIATLSANKAFTYLFSNSVYWSANGAIRVNEGSVTSVNNETALGRCVYDTWYWGDDQQDDREQFVWGDRPR